MFVHYVVRWVLQGDTSSYTLVSIDLRSSKHFILMSNLVMFHTLVCISRHQWCHCVFVPLKWIYEYNIKSAVNDTTTRPKGSHTHGINYNKLDLLISFQMIAMTTVNFVGIIINKTKDMIYINLCHKPWIRSRWVVYDDDETWNLIPHVESRGDVMSSALFNIPVTITKPWTLRLGMELHIEWYKCSSTVVFCYWERSSLGAILTAHITARAPST